MGQHVEQQHDRTVRIKFEIALRESEVSAAADWEELGEPLDDAEYDRLEEVQLNHEARFPR